MHEVEYHEVEYASVVESISKSSAKLHQDISADCQASLLVNMKSGHCLALLDLLYWMPKEYLSMKSLGYSSSILSGLLDYHDKLNLLDYYELLHLFVACRRTLKNIIMAEAGASSLLSVVNEDSFFMSWISKSIHLVIQLMSSSSPDNEHPSKLAIIPLMDHTSYILLIICKRLVGFGASVGGKTDDQYREPYSGEIAEKSLKKSEGFRSSYAFDESLKEEAECLLSSLKDVLSNLKAGLQDSLVHVNKLSLTVSCFCGYLLGLSCALEQMGQRSGELRNRKGTNVFVNLMNTFMQMFCIQNDPDHRSTYGSGKGYPQKPSDEQSRESEPRKLLSVPFNTDDELNSTHVGETSCQIESAKCTPVLTEVDLVELSDHTKNLLGGLLNGDLPEKATSLRQLLIASSAMLRLTGFKREVDEALRPGVYALIDACSDNDLQYLHTAFGEGPCRNTLASLKHDYKLNFQYEGKVRSMFHLPGISSMGYCYPGNCGCGRCRGSSSHPYSVMLFLALALILLGLSPLVKFEVAVEGFEKQLMTLVLLITVLALLVLVRWLSPVDSCWGKCCKCGKCVPWKFSY